MGKWILLLLAVFGMGVFVGREFVGKESVVKESVFQTPPTAAPLDSISSGAPKEDVRTIPVDEKVTPEPSPEPLTPREQSSKRRLEAEKSIAQLRVSADIHDFLEQVKLDDVGAGLASAKPVDRPDEVVEILNGSFVGSMNPQPEFQGFGVFIRAQIYSQNQTLHGRLTVRLTRDGKAFSRTSNSGEIKAIQKFGENSVALLISSGDYHFQLYYMPQLLTFEGNCYHEWKPGLMRYEGTVHLEKAS